MRETAWKLFAKIILWQLAIVFIFFMGAISVDPSLMLVGSVVALLGAMWIILTWLNRYYIVSEEAISKTRGILFRRTRTFDLGSIASVKVSQSIFGQILNYGDVILENPLTKKDLTIKDVQAPYSQASLIEKQRLKEISKSPNKKVVPL